MRATEIRKLVSLNPDDFKRVMTGYTSSRKYSVEKIETREQVVITLMLVELSELYIKKFPSPPSEMEHYRKLVVEQGLSFGAYVGDKLVGIAIAERKDWNRSLWVWELGVDEGHRRVGIGSQLVKALINEAKELGLRVIVCETQNTNSPAIVFYHKSGFELDGIDLSYYSNVDMEGGEVALFMKKRLGRVHLRLSQFIVMC